MKCKYCGKPAGFLKTKHKECEEKHSKAVEDLKNLYKKKITYGLSTPDDVKAETEATISSGYISEKENYALISETVKAMTSKSSVCSDSDIARYDRCIASLPDALRTEITGSSDYVDLWDYWFKRKVLEALEDPQAKLDDAFAFARNRGIEEHEIQKYSVHLVENKIGEYLRDNIIDEQEENEIKNMMERLGLAPSDFLESKPYTMLLQSIILRDLQNGVDISGRVDPGEVPVLLGKNEYVVWGYNNVNAYEEKTGRKYEGGSQGVSIRICKGVYYKVGANKGHAVDYTYTNPLGAGTLVITNKNIIFVGAKAIKFAINKIITFNAYEDGIELMKEGVRAKPTTFTGFDPWFISNLLPLLHS